MELILADTNRNEICSLGTPDIDIDIGNADNFELSVSSDDLRDGLAIGSYVYANDTEYGGRIGELEIDTEENSYKFRGFTWRGFLKKRIIEPPSGQDYRIVSGDLNAIIGDLLELYLPSWWEAPETTSGASVSNYQFDRYCTMYDGLNKMLSSVNYKMRIRCNKCSIVIEAVPIVDYSSQIELSQDAQVDFIMDSIQNGVNHLVCLGSGDLRNRLKVDLFVQADGSIGSTQFYTGIDEIKEVYENNSDETTQKLTEDGTAELEKLKNVQTVSMDVEGLDIDIDIGDIIGGRDYATGINLKQPITSKIWKIDNGAESVEYKVG